MPFRSYTSEDIQASLRSMASGETPEIPAGLLAHLLPPFEGTGDSMPAPGTIEYAGLQWQFHTDAVNSWAVMGRGLDFRMLPIRPTAEWEDSVGERDAALAAGFRYVGAVGLTEDNRPLVLTAPVPDADCFASLLNACIHGLWPKALETAAAESADFKSGDSASWLTGDLADGDSVDWLHELFALGDTRTQGGFDA